MPVKRRKKRKTVRRRKSTSSLKLLLHGRGFRLPHGYKVVRCKTCKHKRRKK